MSFLRWLTLLSASRVHSDVRLIVRMNPVRPDVKWLEEQDFQWTPKIDWMPRVSDLSVAIVRLEHVWPLLGQWNISDIHMSDLLTWWLLAEYGGTVADMDILFIRPLPEIRDDVQVVRFTGSPKADYIPMSFMQGQPCGFWRNAFMSAIQSYSSARYESCGTESIPGHPVGKLSEQIVFPWAKSKHKWSEWQDWFFQKAKWPEIPGDSCGIHWYAGHNQKWVKSINRPDDLKDGCIGQYGKQVLKDAGFCR